ncbi:MAG TPA: tRNA (adenosine(37)-N6)-dimethylallyltransferase MiaA [Kiritimatiellia bacterium]|nr:tRNA (adenosine(37)-N6)-dimethylallyltransferase MiaA [Kiritimatiellia bacterium]
MATADHAPLTVWFLAGATATGKSAVAQCLAEQTGRAILSADAMLVYRRMDIGTAKPSPAERGDVPYFGVDLASPAETFSTGLWLADARRALHAAPPAGLIVAGGTGLYLKALTDGLEGSACDPDARARWQARYAAEGIDGLRRALEARSPGALNTLADPANPRRLIRALEHLDAHGALPTHWRHTQRESPPIPALRLPREQLHARIARRVEAMFAAGLIDEVRTLQRDFPIWSETARHAIGYAEVCALLAGELTQAQAADRIAARTRQLAKRQETWLRHQARVIWIDITDDEPPENVARRVAEIWRLYGSSPVVLP